MRLVHWTTDESVYLCSYTESGGLFGLLAEDCLIVTMSGSSAGQY